jgi:hypothetical protein
MNEVSASEGGSLPHYHLWIAHGKGLETISNLASQF